MQDYRSARSVRGINQRKACRKAFLELSVFRCVRSSRRYIHCTFPRTRSSNGGGLGRLRIEELPYQQQGQQNLAVLVVLFLSDLLRSFHVVAMFVSGAATMLGASKSELTAQLDNALDTTHATKLLGRDVFLC